MAVIAAVVALWGGGHHHGCRTDACERRVDHREHRRTVHRWRRVARPYRGWLASVRWCETGGQPHPYATNTGNGYFGAYQFDVPTWWSVGGRELPHLAAPAEQDYRAVLLRQRRGTAPWPVCG